MILVSALTGKYKFFRVLWHLDTSATLDDLREAVTTLGQLERTARRVLGGAHPLSSAIEGDLRGARAVLRARETGGARESVSSAN